MHYDMRPKPSSSESWPHAASGPEALQLPAGPQGHGDHLQGSAKRNSQLKSKPKQRKRHQYYDDQDHDDSSDDFRQRKRANNRHRDAEGRWVAIAHSSNSVGLTNKENGLKSWPDQSHAPSCPASNSLPPPASVSLPLGPPANRLPLSVPSQWPGSALMCQQFHRHHHIHPKLLFCKLSFSLSTHIFISTLLSNIKTIIALAQVHLWLRVVGRSLHQSNWHSIPVPPRTPIPFVFPPLRCWNQDQ